MLFPSSKLPQEYGGLGVRQLMEFNLALIRKWCWRMLMDSGGLWFRVLATRYGMKRGRLREGGGRGSSWRREIARIREGVGGLGESVVKQVGDGATTFFWTDHWLNLQILGSGGLTRILVIQFVEPTSF
ncbi:cytochrome P450 [Trifolium medium]|uniref:Cytochrome P450 n=1 Tax=Trifolium medium TaxID=97028 RepID=A0A392MWU2_9FABA|nr:cytochrome P450 [Trifolium medium]